MSSPTGASPPRSSRARSQPMRVPSATTWLPTGSSATPPTTAGAPKRPSLRRIQRSWPSRAESPTARDRPLRWSTTVATTVVSLADRPDNASPGSSIFHSSTPEARSSAARRWPDSGTNTVVEFAAG